MTVASVTSRIAYAGGGGGGPFPVPFYFLANSDLKVWLRDADGTETLLALTTDYTVTGAGLDAGGAVTMVSVAIMPGETLVIYRDPTLLQTVAYANPDAFPASTNERALDRGYMTEQRTRELVLRSLRLKETDTLGSGSYDADDQRIINLADPIDPQDAVTKDWADGELAEMEGFLAGLLVSYEMPVQGSITNVTKTADFVVTALDHSKTFVFDCDTAAGPLVATLPTASAFGAGKRVRFRLKSLATNITGGPSEVRFGYVNVSGADRFDDDGPSWPISDIDGGSLGVNTHAPVRVATTVNNTWATGYDNGSTIDGVVLATNDRILIKNQTAGAENGIYIVQASGAPVRASAADTAVELGDALVYVSEGTTNAGKFFKCEQAAGDIVLETTALTFVESVNKLDPVRAASGSNFVLAVLENGTVIDGVTLATNNRILLRAQTAGEENGVYIVQAVGAPVRASDADSDIELGEAYIYVSEGTTNANKTFVCQQAAADIVVDTTELTFAAKKYRLNITQGGDNAAIQRQIDNGEWVVVAGVVGTGGMTTDLNEVKQADHRAGGQEGGFGGEDTVNLRDDMIGVYTSGGTVAKVCLQVALRVQHSYVEFESDGVSRWYRIGGTMDTWAEMDLLFGRNMFYESGTSSSNGNRVGWGIHGNHAIPVDFFYDSKHLRLHTRTNMITEVEDTPEIALRRANVPAVTEGGTSYYPNGTIYIPTPADKSIIIHGTFHNGNVFQGRAGTDVFRSMQEVLTGNGHQGGQREWFTTRLNASGPEWSQTLSSEGKLTLGTDGEVTGQINAAGTGDQPQFFGWAKHATYASDVARLQTTRAGDAAFNYIRCISAATGTPDTDFKVDGTGQIFSDPSASVTMGADYAEMVREWWDQNDGAEDRAGMSVVLVRRDNPEIVIMPDDDEHEDSYIRTTRSLPTPPPREAVIGVVSFNPTILGASGDLRWIKKFLTDPFGRFVMEDYTAVSWEEWKIEIEGKLADPTTLRRDMGKRYYALDAIPEGVIIPPAASLTIDEAAVAFEAAQVVAKKPERVALWTSTPVYETAKRRKVNPDFDPALPNVPRRERLEWDAVGLLGRLPLLKGEVRGRGWIKTGTIALGVEEWLVR